MMMMMKTITMRACVWFVMFRYTYSVRCGWGRNIADADIVKSEERDTKENDCVGLMTIRSYTRVQSSVPT